MRKSFILLVMAMLSLAASAHSPAAAAGTDLSFGGDTRGAAAAGWEGSGVVETRNGIHVLHLAGRKDNDIATTPPLPARAGQKYLLSYRMELTVGAGELNVQFRCQDAAGRALKPEWEYPTIETHAVSLPRPTTVLREVSLVGVESATDSVRVVFKWWGTPTGDVWIHDVTWQPLEASPALRDARPLDLRAASNRGFRSGDAVGAWMGEGSNDLSGLEPGTRTIAGVPLVILDPAANGGRSCVVLGNGSRAGFPRQVTIPVGQRAERVFVLHNAAFGPGAQPFISSVATWTFQYTDGTKASVHLDAGIHMADWSYPEDTDQSLVAVTTASPGHPLVGLNLAEISNPRPEAEIRAIQVAADGDGLYGLVAATLADGGPGAAATLADGAPWIADLKLQTRVEYEKATGEWFPAALPWGAPEMPSPTNVSWLLDKPAGKHGFVHARNGQFVFDDGSRARFLAATCGWSSWAVSHQDAEKMAAYLSRVGVNLLRIYPLGFVSGAGPRTFMLDPDKQEKLDYLLAQLRSRGIYVYFYTSIVQLQDSPLLSALTHGTASRNRSLGLFDPEWLAAEERYWNLLLTHVNPYTGRSLAQDPMLAMLVLTNENEMYSTYEDSSLPVPAVFQDEVRLLWNQWLVEQYGSRDRLAGSWAAMGAAPLQAGEDPARSTVPLPTLSERGRAFDFRRFCAAIQQRFAGRITGSLRAMGVRCPLQSTNHIYTPEGVFLMEQADFSGIHRYGPYQDGSKWTEPNYSVLKTFDPLKGSTASFPNADAIGRLVGKPFVLGEWNIGYPNDFRGSGILQAFAYGLLQDWDCLNYFCFFENAATLGPDSPAVSDSLASAFDPARVGLFPAIALLFYRQDISPARQSVTRTFTHADIQRMEQERGYPGGLSYNVREAAWPPFVHRYAIAPEPVTPPAGAVVGGAALQQQLRDLRRKADQEGLIDEQRHVVRSDHGELSSDFASGFLTIDTPRTQGASGSLEGAPEIKLSRLQISGASTDGTVLFSSLDGAPLGVSGRILVTVVGDACNTGEISEIDRADIAEFPAHGRFHPSRYWMQASRAGRKPMLAEPVGVTLRLRRDAGAPGLHCQALDPAGNPVGAVPVSRTGPWTDLRVEGKYRSIYFLLSK